MVRTGTDEAEPTPLPSIGAKEGTSFLPHNLSSLWKRVAPPMLRGFSERTRNNRWTV